MARMSRYFITLFSLLMVSAAHLAAQTVPLSAMPMPKTADALLQLALTQNDIDVEGLKPWELKATFQLYDEKGKPTETATLDEIWGGRKQQKRTWASPSFNQVEVVNEQGTFRSGSQDEVPLTLEHARLIMVHPMPPADDISEAKTAMLKKRFNKVDLNCVELFPSIKGQVDTPPAPFSMYCFDRDHPIYLAGYGYGEISYVVNTVGKFQNRYIGLTDSVAINDILLVKGTIGDLRTIPNVDASMFVTPANATIIQRIHGLKAPGVTAGNLLYKKTPVYPAAAKATHEQGTVLLRAIIGRDGHIHSLRVESTPRTDMGEAAMAAVRHWIYKPYLQNGEPTEVDTIITVNFRTGP